MRVHVYVPGGETRAVYDGEIGVPSVSLPSWSRDLDLPGPPPIGGDIYPTGDEGGWSERVTMVALIVAPVGEEGTHYYVETTPLSDPPDLADIQAELRATGWEER